MDLRTTMMVATVIIFLANVYRLKHHVTSDARLYLVVSLGVLAYWLQALFFPAT